MWSFQQHSNNGLSSLVTATEVQQSSAMTSSHRKDLGLTGRSAIGE